MRKSLTVAAVSAMASIWAALTGSAQSGTPLTTTNCEFYVTADQRYIDPAVRGGTGTLAKSFGIRVRRHRSIAERCFGVLVGSPS